MDPKVDEIGREVKDIRDNLSRLIYKFDSLEKQIEAIYREVGASSGRNLEAQISNIENKLAELDPLVTEAARDSRAARKLVEYGDVRLKEIMQALSIIYRNTDELEENLLDADSLNTPPGQ